MFIQIRDDVDGTIHTFPLNTVKMDELSSNHWEEPGTYFVNGTKVNQEVYSEIMKLIIDRGINEGAGLTKVW